MFDYMFTLEEVDELMANFDKIMEIKYICAHCNKIIDGMVYSVIDGDTMAYICQDGNEWLRGHPIFRPTLLGYANYLRWDKDAPVYDCTEPREDLVELMREL